MDYVDETNYLSIDKLNESDKKLIAYINSWCVYFYKTK